MKCVLKIALEGQYSKRKGEVEKRATEAIVSIPSIILDEESLERVISNNPDYLAGVNIYGCPYRNPE